MTRKFRLAHLLKKLQHVAPTPTRMSTVVAKKLTRKRAISNLANNSCIYKKIMMGHMRIVGYSN